MPAQNTTKTQEGIWTISAQQIEPGPPLPQRPASTLHRLTLHFGQDVLEPFHGLRYAALKPRKAEFLEKDKEATKYYLIF